MAHAACLSAQLLGRRAMQPLTSHGLNWRGSVGVHARPGASTPSAMRRANGHMLPTFT